MTRKATPDLLAEMGVSRETGASASTGSAYAADAVAVAMGTDVGAGAPAVSGSVIHWLPLERVLHNPYQTRLGEDVAHIAGLARSIRAERANLPDTLGLQQAPLGRMVWRLRDGRIEVLEPVDYANPGAVASLVADGVFVQLAFGHSRRGAFELLARGFSTKFPNYDPGEVHLRMEFLDGDPAYGRIPVRIAYLDDAGMWGQAVRENHDRQDLNALEEAHAMRMAMDKLGMSTEQVGRVFGYERSSAANKLRLLQLPAAAQDLIKAGSITERHGRELLRLSGAPAWQAKFVDELASQAAQDQVATVARLRQDITHRIRLNGKPMPAEPVEMTGMYREKEMMQPAPWPLDGFAPRSPAVRGECAGCALLVTFDRERAPRCTDGTCYAAKERLWKEREQERQKAAAVAAVAQVSQRIETTNAGLPAAAGEGAGGGASTSSAADGVRWTRKDRYSARVFGTADAPGELMERGLCGSEQCECFALMMAGEWDVHKSHLGPDREAAPNVVFVCENSSRLRKQRNRLEELEAPEKAAERKAAVAEKSAETREAKGTLRELWEALGVEGLAKSQPAVARMAQTLVTGYSYGGDEKGWQAKELEELWEAMFWWLAEKRCKEAYWNDEGNRVVRWDAAKATALRDQLLGEARRPEEQPGPGDSQSTGWREGWDEDDDGLYLMFKAYGPLRSWTETDFQRINLPRVALRLIEECDDKAVRGVLWNRYNKLLLAGRRIIGTDGTDAEVCDE